MSWNKEEFKEKLEQEHSFPGVYMFKFILPVARESEVMKILPKGEITKKLSKKNNYLSITVKGIMKSSLEVISVYEQAYTIEGIIAL